MTTTKLPKQLIADDYPRGVVTLTDGATVAVDASLGDIFDLAMAGDHALGAPTNPSDGHKVLFRITASGGTRAPSFNAVFRVDANTTLPTSISSGKTVIVGAIYNAGAVKWDVPFVSGEF